MNKESKIRKKAVELLSKENWVIWFSPKVKFKKTDVFGIFDLICWQKKTAQLKFIQLTTLSNLSARIKKIKNFLKKNRLLKQNLVGIEVWAWNKRQKTFKIELI